MTHAPTYTGRMNRNLWLLALCQGLFLTNNVAFIAINGLVGLSLAPFGWMATLPVMGYVVGGALSTPLVARTQSLFGRRISFQIGLAVALASACVAAWAIVDHNFWLLVAATVVAGYYSANGQLYRFAAAELVPAPQREKAVSLVLAGGLIGAIAGPNLAARSRGLLDVPFAGAYIVFGSRRPGGHGVDGLHPLSQACDRAQRTRRWPAACGDHGPTGVHRRLRQRGLGLWRHEPVDGSHATGHAAVRPVI